MHLVLSTFPSEEKAVEIARILLTERLIRCANIIPAVRSLYEWRGEICDEAEVLMVLKCAQELSPALQTRLRILHPYELPEIVAIQPDAVLPEYRAWVRDGAGREN